MTTNEHIAVLKRLVSELIEVGDKLVCALDRRLDRKSHRTLIMIGWVAKVTKMLRSLLAEINGPAPENSLIQARVLLETLVNFEYFATEMGNNSNAAVKRFWDAMALQMGKKFRLMGVHPEASELSLEVRAASNKAHTQAAARIGDQDEVKKVERHGFYGETIEARCEKMGRKRHYDLLYRPFCDPVHGSDILQCAVMVVEPDEGAAIVSNLIPPVLAVGYETGVRVFRIVNVVCGEPVTTDLDLIAAKGTSLQS